MKLKYLIISVGILLVIMLSIFIVRTIHMISSDMAGEAVQDKIMQTEIIDKIMNQLDSYPVSGMVLSHSASEDIDIKFSTKSALEDNEKAEIKQIVNNIIRQNGFKPDTFNIIFDSEQYNFTTS